MKTKILLSFLMVLWSLTTFAQSDSIQPGETEWVAIKESSIDSLTLNYMHQKGLVKYTTPKDQNNSVFLAVVEYIADLWDSSLSSITRNTNKFYNTPVGFWATWGVFYHYVGNEIIKYLLTFLYLVVITLLFLWLWRKFGIHKTIPIDPDVIQSTDKHDTEHVTEQNIHKQATNVHTEDNQDKKQEDTTMIEYQYEVKSSDVNMQFWLFLTYIVLFFAGACIL